MAFKIDKKTAELMYQHQSGFIPKDPAIIKQYMETVNADPEKWASTYKHVTGKDMPLPKAESAEFKVNPAYVKDWLQSCYLTPEAFIPAEALSNWVNTFNQNLTAYANLLYAIGVPVTSDVEAAAMNSEESDPYIISLVASSGKKKGIDTAKTPKQANAATKGEKPIATTKHTDSVDPLLVQKWYTTIHNPGAMGNAGQLSPWIKEFTSNPDKYKKAIADLTAPAAPVAKKQTLSQKIKAIPVKMAGPDVEYNELDPEAIEMFQTAKQLLKAANGNKDYGTEFSKAWTLIRDNLEKSNNGVEYLKTVVRTLDPTWKPWDPKQKVKPGGMHGLPVPTDKLSPTAQSLTASPETEAKAAALAVKIKEYEAEIDRLKKLQKAADTAKAKAAKEKEKLAGIDPKLLQYFSYIEQHCSDFLKSAQAANKFLYRGQRDTKLPVFVGRPRADREPKDSSVEAQKLADKCLTIMGFKALRSNSIFTSADYNQADNYGTVYAIFPKNGFDFTWSTKHDDLVIHATGELTGYGGDDDNVYYDWNYTLEDYTYIRNNVYESDVVSWITDNSTIAYIKAQALAKIVRKTPEYVAMLKALKAWYKLDDDDKKEKLAKALVDVVSAMFAFDDLKLVKGWLGANDRKKLTKYLKEANDILSTAVDPKAADKDKALAEKVIKHMGFTKDNLVAALKSEHEICVLGEYVAVNAYAYKKELRRYFMDAMPAATKGVVKPNYKPNFNDDGEMDKDY